MENIAKKNRVEHRWVELIKKAKTLGLTPEEVREFLIKSRKNH